jgi:type I restriction enzyme R subunit
MIDSSAVRGDLMSELHFFDPHSEYSILERRLPHWAQSGVVCFITWRTDDSIPADVLQRWRVERWQWLRRHAINPRATDWRQRLKELKPETQKEFFETFSSKWHNELDASHGACVLKHPNVAKIVAESLQKFDGERYELTDFVVMPNHVHLLATFQNEDLMLVQCEGWKHYQAVQINRAIGSRGRFWQQDGFDHLVRSAEQFDHFRRYIADNPKKARLSVGEYITWSNQSSRSEPM